MEACRNLLTAARRVILHLQHYVGDVSNSTSSTVQSLTSRYIAAILECRSESLAVTSQF